MKKLILYIVFNRILLPSSFPKALNSYVNEENLSILEIIISRIKEEPFNLVASIIFLLAIIHMFMTSHFLKLAHKKEKEFKNSLYGKKEKINGETYMFAKLLHFLGDVETVFGLWTIALAMAISIFYDWSTFVKYVGDLHYIEPMFVVVVMTIASSRPIIKLFELLLWKLVKLLGGSLEAWWIVILTIGPLLGSIISEPAAMIVSAHLLADKFFDINPSKKLKYITLALLLANISIGGALTSFGAPPILMISKAWSWNSAYVFFNIGIKAFIAIILTNSLYFFYVREELKNLKESYVHNIFKRYVQRKFISQIDLENKLNQIEGDINNKLGFTETFQKTCTHIKEEIKIRAVFNLTKDEIEKYNVDLAINQRFEDIKREEMRKSIPGLLPIEDRPNYRDPNWDNREDKVPYWIMIAHIFFMIWTIINAHEPVLFIGGFLFFLAFIQVTSYYQNRINLKPALLVAFFLSGLVIHGGVQTWWIEPIISNLGEIPLTLSALFMSSFNDNSAIVYLATLIENFSENLRYFIVVGAISGGGLTIMSNAPNPVAQSILKKYFDKGISSYELFKMAVIPAIIFTIVFLIL